MHDDGGVGREPKTYRDDPSRPVKRAAAERSELEREPSEAPPVIVCTVVRTAAPSDRAAPLVLVPWGLVPRDVGDNLARAFCTRCRSGVLVRRTRGRRARDVAVGCASSAAAAGSAVGAGE